jgi:hypothetical protein
VREVQLGDLNFAHLDFKNMSPAHAHVNVGDTTLEFILLRVSLFIFPKLSQLFIAIILLTIASV